MFKSKTIILFDYIPLCKVYILYLSSKKIDYNSYILTSIEGLL